VYVVIVATTIVVATAIVVVTIIVIATIVVIATIIIVATIGIVVVATIVIIATPIFLFLLCILPLNTTFFLHHKRASSIPSRHLPLLPVPDHLFAPSPSSNQKNSYSTVQDELVLAAMRHASGV
jgi:hypothetical protein